jgi:hypothetical protein
LAFPHYTKSANGVPIRLTDERWYHITKHHPELRPFRHLILTAVAHPTQLFFFSQTADFAAVAKFSELASMGLASNVVVHYKEVTKRDGFIVTAFPMSSGRIKRRFSRWRRLR